MKKTRRLERVWLHISGINTDILVPSTVVGIKAGVSGSLCVIFSSECWFSRWYLSRQCGWNWRGSRFGVLGLLPPAVSRTSYRSPQLLLCNPLTDIITHPHPIFTVHSTQDQQPLLKSSQGDFFLADSPSSAFGITHHGTLLLQKAISKLSVAHFCLLLKNIF